jgi:hypothetical protein
MSTNSTSGGAHRDRTDTTPETSPVRTGAPSLFETDGATAQEDRPHHGEVLDRQKERYWGSSGVRRSSVG